MSVNCLNHAYQRRIVDLGWNGSNRRLQPWDERPSRVLLEDVQAALFACACHHARNCGRLAQSLSMRSTFMPRVLRGGFLTNSGAVLFSVSNEPLGVVPSFFGRAP